MLLFLRPSFTKLEEWLENLLMHLDIGLPLLSELEQLRRAFWQNRSHQDLLHSQDETPDSPDLQRCSPNPKRRSNTAKSPAEPNHLTQSQEQFDALKSHLHGHEETLSNYEMTQQESDSCPQDQSQTFCKSATTDSDHKGFDSEHQASQPQEVKNSQLGQPNRIQKICRVLWDRTTEGSSFL